MPMAQPPGLSYFQKAIMILILKGYATAAAIKIALDIRKAER